MTHHGQGLTQRIPPVHSVLVQVVQVGHAKEERRDQHSCGHSVSLASMVHKRSDAWVQERGADLQNPSGEAGMQGVARTRLQQD